MRPTVLHTDERLFLLLNASACLQAKLRDEFLRIFQQGLEVRQGHAFLHCIILLDDLWIEGYARKLSMFSPCVAILDHWGRLAEQCSVSENGAMGCLRWFNLG